MINIKRRRELVSSLNYMLLKRKKITVKFAVKLFKEAQDGTNYYYHTEYMYVSKRRKDDVSINLNPSSYIMISISDDDEQDGIYVTETIRNIILTKASKFIQMIQAYLTGSIDLYNERLELTKQYGDLMVDVSYQKTIMKFYVVIRENVGDIGIRIELMNNSSVDISIYDFMDVMYKLRSIDYTNMTMSLLNYYITHPTLGDDARDIRKFAPNITDNVDDLVVVTTKNELEKSLKEILTPTSVSSVNNKGW